MNTPEPITPEGPIWEVLDGCEVHIQYLFSAPITFNGAGRLAAGERIRILPPMGGPQAGVVSFVPVRYDELHDSLVPKDIRETPRYKRYVLSVKAEFFQQHFILA